MSKKADLINMMLPEGKEDLMGKIALKSRDYGFYDFVDRLDMSKEEYENLIRELSREKCIEIKLNGGKDYSCATIIIKREAVKYLEEV